MSLRLPIAGYQRTL